MSETYELSTLRIIVKRTIEQGSEEADTLYLIPGSAFARYEEGAFYREFAQLFNYDSGTPWAHDGSSSKNGDLSPSGEGRVFSGRSSLPQDLTFRLPQ
jgi:hypothetical protein